MRNLVEALTLFNRKERYWLIRNAIGPKATTLCDEFRDELGSVTGLDIPADAWWAMDYHLDWLVGALHIRENEIGVLRNTSAPDGLVHGNQEDVDFVVAFDQTLILVEAKGVTSWGSNQMNKKVERLTQIFEHQDLIKGLKLRYVLMSPKPSEGLSDKVKWPEWMLSATKRDQHGNRLPMHVKMKIDAEVDLLRVTRWNLAEKKPDIKGQHWNVVKAR